MKIENFFKKMLCVFLSLMIIIPASLSNYFASETINKNWCPPIPLDDSDSDSNSDTETVVPEGPSVDSGACAAAARPEKSFDESEFINLAKNVTERLDTEYRPIISDLEGDVLFVGDLHGNLQAAMCWNRVIRQAFEEGRCTHVVFGGDYVDRGQYSLEVLLIVLRLKWDYWDRVTLLRGNHEDVGICFEILPNILAYEITKKCKKHVGDLYDVAICCCNMFSALPLAAIANNNTLFVHAGVPCEDDSQEQFISLMKLKFENFEDIRQMDIVSIPNSWSPLVKMAKELLWNDPKLFICGGPGYIDSPRGVGHLFDVNLLKKFFESFNIKNPGFSVRNLVRAHEWGGTDLGKEDPDRKNLFNFGFERMYTEAPASIYTVFSSFNYGDIGENGGAIAIIHRDGSVEAYMSVDKDGKVIIDNRDKR